MTAETAYRILVLGGYGQFGSRIVRMLSGDANCHVIIAGRHRDRAAALLDSVSTAASSLSVTEVDTRSLDFPARLAAARPDLVIHTAGPFVDRNYAVARACIEAGVHYIDLADNRRFALNITQLDVDAQRRNVLVVSGASTVPALSTAVVDRYRHEFSRIDRIATGITPGSRAPRGLSTIESVLAYCGRPYEAWREGRWQPVYGWQDLHRVHYPSLGTRWFANCDVPDLELFPQRYKVADAVEFAAALELRTMQFSMWAMSWLARSRLVRNWVPAARILKAASDPLNRFGTDRGGMHVHIDGVDLQGNPHRVRWFVTARHGDGPMIPCIASVVLARKLARGLLQERGARICTDMMTLDEFKLAVSNFAISFTLA